MTICKIFFKLISTFMHLALVDDAFDVCGGKAEGTMQDDRFRWHIRLRDEDDNMRGQSHQMRMNLE